MSRPRQHLLDAVAIDAYAKVGAAALRDALGASEPDHRGHFIEDFCTWLRNPACADVLQRPAFPLVWPSA